MPSSLEEWRENAKHMYERLDTIRLEWSSFTCQWSKQDDQGTNAFVSTYTNNSEDEFVREVVVDTDKYLPPTHEVRSWKVPPKKIIESKPQEQERVRQCPKNPKYTASISAYDGEIFIWKKNAKPFEPGVSKTLYTRLPHNKTGGFGLEWEPETKNGSKAQLVTGCEDGLLSSWSVDLRTPAESKFIRDVDLGSCINDVSWTHPNLIVASLENGQVRIFDKDLNLVSEIQCNEKDVTSAAISPFSKNLLLVGTSDNKLKLFDLRTKSQVYENQVHTSEITCVKWSPHRDGVFASTGNDCVVYIWDIKNIGTEQSYEDSLDGVPEMIFKHNGHLNGVVVQDLDWHPLIDMLLLSTDGKNVLMSWQPNSESIDEVDIPKMPSYVN